MGDNVIMQLTGEADVVVFPANCSFETWRLPNKVVVREWLSRTADGKPLPKGSLRVPYFHMMLRQGEGVVIPSYAFHKVVSRQSSRVGMNAFMEPRFRKMRWKDSPSNYFLRASDGAEAMRVLFLKSSSVSGGRGRCTTSCTRTGTITSESPAALSGAVAAASSRQVARRK